MTQRSAGGSVRIVGGRWRRTPLPVPDEPGLRPTPARVRETVFNWLAHAFGALDDRSALDLFAGSGALGFEAASRGASSVVLVDDNPRVIETLRAVKNKLSATNVEIIRGDALRIADVLRERGRLFDVVFLDPPFATRIVDTLLPAAASLCQTMGYVYVESDRRLNEDLLAAAGVAPYRADKAGDVFYHLLQRKKTD